MSSPFCERGSCRQLLQELRCVAAIMVFYLCFFCPQSMSKVLSPGLAVSVLKAIFQEVHVQVSNVISYPPVLDLCSLCV